MKNKCLILAALFVGFIVGATVSVSWGQFGQSTELWQLREINRTTDKILGELVTIRREMQRR